MNDVSYETTTLDTNVIQTEAERREGPKDSLGDLPAMKNQPPILPFFKNVQVKKKKEAWGGGVSLQILPGSPSDFCRPNL